MPTPTCDPPPKFPSRLKAVEPGSFRHGTASIWNGSKKPSTLRLVPEICALGGLRWGTRRSPVREPGSRVYYGVRLLPARANVERHTRPSPFMRSEAAVLHGHASSLAAAA